MFAFRKASLALGMAGALAVGCATSAVAGGSIKDGPVDTGRQFAWSFNIAGTSDYVFRGISQSWADPAVQGGIDVTYGILYAGVWASTLDFDGGAGSPADVELDFTVGVKPVWGPVTFDFGVIYYTYPAARDPGAELNMVEFKAGASFSPVDKLTVGGLVYYSPEFTGEVGEVWTFEGTAAYEFRKVGMFTPTLSGTLGYAYGDEGFHLSGMGGDDDYLYWNAGVTFAVEKFSFDFRYWDTDIGSDGGVCVEKKLCDDRFVFTAKFTY